VSVIIVRVGEHRVHLLESDRVVVERVSDRLPASLTVRQLQHRVLSFVVQRASAKAIC
jgi:hypothetical protein